MSNYFEVGDFTQLRVLGGLQFLFSFDVFHHLEILRTTDIDDYLVPRNEYLLWARDQTAGPYLSGELLNVLLSSLNKTPNHWDPQCRGTNEWEVGES